MFRLTRLDASGIELVEIVGVRAHSIGSYLMMNEFVSIIFCPIMKI